MADMIPDVSIIITAYNVERYIERTLQSALEQQGVTLEVIVADDCSNDDTWAILSKHTDPRIKRLRLDRNSGPGAARNAAIAEATGAWIAVLDGDDMFLPGRLARCLEHAKTQQADIVIDNLLVHREADNKQFPMFPPAQFAGMHTLDLAAFIVANKLFSGDYALGYAKPIFSAAFLRRHKLAYDPDIRIGEDYLLLAEALACNARCAVEPTPGYQYTVRPGSISHRLAEADITAMLEGDAKLLARHILSPPAAKAQKDRENTLKKAYAFTLLINALKQKNMADALKAITSCPSCIWLLRIPVKVRLCRLITFLFGQRI